ncbi:MAG: GNAT family N-acetyltransferase [Candidatus Promineifilaceae bacterium]|jgi:CelD/BcsL family acetyltransferase involved in cellulose biosynthesis
MSQEQSYQLINPADQRWLNFITTRKEANIFHHPAWIRTLAVSYGYRPFVVVDCDKRGEITAGVPMMEVNSYLTGRRWVSLPYSDHCSPLYRDDESLEKLLSSLELIYSSEVAPKIEVRWDYSKNPAFAVQPEYYLHTLRLGKSTNDLFAGVKKSFRQCVKQAQKKGVRIERGDENEQFQQFYRQMVITRRQHGVPVQPKRFFDLLRTFVIDKGLGQLLCAYRGDRYLASLLVLHWQKTMTIKYSCSSLPKSDMQMRPNHLLYWTAICWGAENGFASIDMGRCSLSNSGLRDYKLRWGVQEEMLNYSYLSTDPASIDHGNLLPILQRVIRRSPPIVCQLTGELLYKHFA